LYFPSFVHGKAKNEIQHLWFSFSNIVIFFASIQLGLDMNITVSLLRDDKFGYQYFVSCLNKEDSVM